MSKPRFQKLRNIAQSAKRNKSPIFFITLLLSLPLLFLALIIAMSVKDAHAGTVTFDTPRGELFIHSNPWAGDLYAGENAGFQVWIGRDLTATPAAGGQVAGTIYITNELNRYNLWGLNVVAMQLKGETDGWTRAAEFEVHRSIGVDASADPYDGFNPRANGIEIIAHTDNTDLLTSAIMTWAGEKTGVGWWQEGISLSRVTTTGLHFHNLNDETPAFQNAAILDSGSGTTLKVEGYHDNIVDVSGATFYNFVRLSDNKDQVLAFSGERSWTMLLDSGSEDQIKQTMLAFSDNGVAEYSFIKNAGNDFVLYDHPRNKTILMFDTHETNPTRLFVDGELRRVELGAKNSAGPGYRSLRVLN